MAWIESHTNLEKHHKLIRFQTAMRWSRNEAVGFLHRFWWSVLEVSPSGDVTALTSPEVMSETLNMKPDVAQDAILKLEQCGFLDRKGDGKLFVHGWLKYAGMYLSQSLFKRNPRRMKEIRKLHGMSKVCPRTVLDTNQPDQPDQPDQPKEKAAHKPRQAFVKPSAQEVTEFSKSNGKPIDGEAFVAFYESKGWLIGKSPMKSWKAAVVTWQKRGDFNGGGSGARNGNVFRSTGSGVESETAGAVIL